MATNLTVNNSVFAYPDPGDEPGWGEGASGWAAEVTDVLANVQGPDDISQTTFNIANNQTSSTDVTGLVFSTATVRSALVDYSIYIVTSSNEKAEKGQLELIYKNGATVGQKWSIGQVFFGDDSGVRFTMTDAGQIQYTSSNIAGTSYVGTMHFEAKAIQQ